MQEEISKFIINHILLSSTWLILVAIILVINLRHNYFKIVQINVISQYEAIRLINKESALIVDIRSREDYRQGHIINSINILETEMDSVKLELLSQYKKKPVLLVCTTGNRSIRTAKKLKSMGFQRIYLLQEGIIGWKKINFPLVISNKLKRDK